MDAAAASTKSVAIVGAGVSGLAACKHLLARGFLPVVFEAGDGLGGAWRHALPSTRLQTPASSYRFSDFPWPTTAEVFPRYDQVVAYLAAYARRFGVLERVRFGCKVLAAEYAGAAAEEQVAAWERWAGNGDGSGEWVLTVQHRGSEATQVYRFDFLILCMGMYSGVPNIPTFPANQGPEAFRGKVLHSTEYAAMGTAAAAELIRGKRVAVVGSGKSAYDTVAECADANAGGPPCTMVCRSPRWMVNGGFVWGGVSIGQLFMSRLAELMVPHKPGEGIALRLLATLMSPLRWAISRVAEEYFKARIPMMREHGMVPRRSFASAVSACRLGVLTERFYDRVAEGSVVIERTRDSVAFCLDGLVLDGGHAGERVVEADVVVLATGFRGAEKLRGIFASRRFQSMVAAGPDNPAPLYRQCLHPRIPQVAVIGYSDSGSSMYHYEMVAKWVAHLLDGAVRLPAVAGMERSVAEWGDYARRHGSGGGGGEGPCISAACTWFNDELCRDMGYNPRRKKGILADWFEPYGPADYAGIR